MTARACTAAMVVLAAIVALGLRPAPRPIEIPDPCEDGARLESIDPDRGRTRLLTCPVPCDGAACPRAPGGAAALLMGIPVDVNRADVDELRSLPGIGPGLARRIVADRNERGPFLGPEDLRRVKGIGAGKLRALEGSVAAGR